MLPLINRTITRAAIKSPRALIPSPMRLSSPKGRNSATGYPAPLWSKEANDEAMKLNDIQKNKRRAESIRLASLPPGAVHEPGLSPLESRFAPGIIGVPCPPRTSNTTDDNPSRKGAFSHGSAAGISVFVSSARALTPSPFVPTQSGVRTTASFARAAPQRERCYRLWERPEETTETRCRRNRQPSSPGGRPRIELRPHVLESERN